MFAISENPDEMAQNAPFHQDLHYMLSQTHSSKKYIKVKSGSFGHQVNSDSDPVCFIL